MRSRLREALGLVVDAAPVELALRLLERADRGERGVFGVLTYHRVEEPGAVRGHPGMLSATPDQFADQMAYLRRAFRPVGLDDLLEARHGGRALPPRAVLVTFDDAYRDFAVRAWPILRRHRIPATLFVPTAYPDDAARWFWWDWLHESLSSAPAGSAFPTPQGEMRIGGSPAERADVARRLRADLKEQPHDRLLAIVTEIGERLGCRPPANPVLAWAELRALAGDGVSLAPHSRTHPLLNHIDGADLDAELIGPIADLEREVGAAPRALAYPSGAITPTIREAVARAGYSIGFTTRRGLNRSGDADWLALSRINVGRATSVNGMRLQLGRWALAWS